MSTFVVAPDRRRIRAKVVQSRAAAMSHRTSDRIDEVAPYAEAVDRFLRNLSFDVLRTPGTVGIAGGSTRSFDRPAVGTGEIVTIRADPAEVRAKAKVPGAGSVLVEPRLDRWVGGLGPNGHVATKGSSAFAATQFGPGSPEAVVQIVVRSGGTPLQGARVSAYWRRQHRLHHVEAKSDSNGTCSLRVHSDCDALVAVEPCADHWAMASRVSPGDQTIAVDCPPIREIASDSWWLRQVGNSRIMDHWGQGIRIGIVDTGVGPHPNLAHARAFQVVGAGVVEDYPTPVDLRGHGTHVAGLIGARATSSCDVRGLAPAAELLVTRIFGVTGSASQADVASAILDLSSAGSDLINLSLAAPTPSKIERQEIQDALDRGTLCIAAAGNAGGAVEYPAAYREVVGVAALGAEGQWQIGSLSADRSPAVATDWGRDGLFGANFSNRGPQVSCSAPGVAILSTVASAVTGAVGRAVMDGSSMAAPICTAALGAALSEHQEYRDMPPSRGRTSLARRILASILRTTGLPSGSWGKGMPRL